MSEGQAHVGRSGEGQRSRVPPPPGASQPVAGTMLGPFVGEGGVSMLTSRARQAWGETSEGGEDRSTVQHESSGKVAEGERSREGSMPGSGFEERSSGDRGRGRMSMRWESSGSLGRASVLQGAAGSPPFEVRTRSEEGHMMMMLRQELADCKRKLKELGHRQGHSPSRSAGSNGEDPGERAARMELGIAREIMRQQREAAEEQTQRIRELEQMLVVAGLDAHGCVDAAASDNAAGAGSGAADSASAAGGGECENDAGGGNSIGGGGGGGGGEFEDDGEENAAAAAGHGGGDDGDGSRQRVTGELDDASSWLIERLGDGDEAADQIARSVNSAGVMRGNNSRGSEVLLLRCERDAAIEEARNLRSEMDRCLGERDAVIEEARNLRNGVVTSLEKTVEDATM